MFQIDNLYFISTRNVRGKQARMRVPKLVKNGINSSFGVWVGFESMYSEWITETVANGKK
jgi:hypothetical protein